MRGHRLRVRVERVGDRPGRRAFFRLPYALHRDDPNFVPPLRISERARLDPEKNPFFDHAEADFFLARRDERTVGRVAAIVDREHDRVHGDGAAFFGFFEASDSEVAAALLERAESWSRERGRALLRGPANPSLNDTAGLLVDGFDSDPFVMMPHNPPGYPEWVEAAGYGAAKDLYAWYVDIQSPTPPRFARLAERVRRRVDPLIRPIDMRRFDDEVEVIRDIFCQAWGDNWGFVPPTDAEFRHMASDLKLVIDPELVLMMELDGRIVGFSLTLPDLHQIFKRIDGRLLPTGIFQLLRLKLRGRHPHVDGARMALLGVLPEYRRRGLELLLIDAPLERVRALGYRRGECSWTLEDNEAVNRVIEAVGGERYKTYRIYEKPLR